MAEKVKKVLGVLGITLAVYLSMKYLLPIVAPFFVAYLLVRWIYPLASGIEKKVRIKKELVSLVLLLLGTAAISFLIWYLVSSLCAQIRSVVGNLDYYEAQIEGLLSGFCGIMERTFGVSSGEMKLYLYQNIERMTDQLQTQVVPGLVQHSMLCVMIVMKVLGMAVLIFIAVLLLMRDYDSIREKLEQLRGYRKAVNVSDRLWALGGKYLRAQGTIMLIVIVICVVGLWLSGSSYALLVGIIIGTLDVLPFIGTGTILIPWAAVCLLQGDFFHGAVYFTLFLVANTTREYLEPRMLGDQLGVYPIVIAMTVYAGLKIYGVAGILLGPVSLLVILECTRELWKKNKEI